ALGPGPSGALGAGGSPSAVLGLLVWALIADTPYHLYPAYGWVMFVAVFLWLVTIILFILYLFQLHMKLYMVPWPLVLMIFNISATVLYITAFIACSAAVDLTSLRGTRPYNQRAAASVRSRPQDSRCLLGLRPGTCHLLRSCHLNAQWVSEGSWAASRLP
uniref:Plasmolipin n=1 Tax=Mandrillus leucophaeus TaxID=9568 RepID=A0A2K6AH16_MANLE